MQGTVLDLVGELDMKGHPCLLRAHTLLGGGGGGGGGGQSSSARLIIVSAIKQTS